MAWMTSLYETYENLEKSSELLKACKMPLVPVSHTVQTAHVEVTLKPNGDFVRAECIPAEMALMVVPCTEDSACRTSGTAPHMIFDNLKYTAGDAAEYNGDKKIRKNYEAYCEQLKKWCDEDDCPEFVKAVYTYVSKGRLMHDLMEQGIIMSDNGKLKWTGSSDNKPAGDLLGTFVRFNVLTESGEDVDLNELAKAYIEYDKRNYNDVGTCFVTGERSRLTYKHPGKLRYSGDNAKLISSNDTTGFTYRGRFRRAEDAFAIGYEVSQKAHSAFRWLIANQGYKTGDQTVVVWAVNNAEIPGIMDDSMSWDDDLQEQYDEYTPLDIYAKNVEKALNGYLHKDLDKPLENNKVAILIAEAATPGRFSIEYYKEFTGFDYIENIKIWHKSCVWNHDYKTVDDETDQETGAKIKTKRHIKYTGAPSVYDMITAVYGVNVDDKLKKRLTETLISCIADRRCLPHDIIMSGVSRISNPTGMEEWDINKSTSVICALIRKYYYDKGVEYDMALDHENNDRSYLFGRVLAYAERIEEYANFLSGERRVPNARKFRSKFRVQPAKTLMTIDDKLEPYVQKTYFNGGKMYDEMQNVIARINELDFMDNKPLSPLYLLGYASQKAELIEAAKKARESKESNIETED